MDSHAEYPNMKKSHLSLLEGKCWASIGARCSCRTDHDACCQRTESKSFVKAVCGEILFGAKTQVEYLINF